jgi:hypothetical protein
MRTQIILSILGLVISGCGSSFNVASSDSNSGGIPTLPSGDIAGKGGSLYLMQTGAPIGTMSLTLPTGAWKTGCINGSGSHKTFITVDSQTAYVISRIYIGNGCDEANLDMIQTQRYTFSSMGTAPVAFDANILRTSLMQIWEEPQTNSAKNDVDSRCGDTASVVGTARDTSLCTDTHGDPQPIGVDDQSTLFWTDSNILRLGTSAGLGSVGNDGYYTR